MQTENISRFTVHYSAKKVVIAAFSYGFVSILFALMGLFLGFVILFMSVFMLVFAGSAGWFTVFLVMAHKNDRPVAVIDAEGFEGLRWFRWRRFSWTAQTQLSSRQHGAITLRNVPENPTLLVSMRELWMPKECIVVSNAFSLESVEEIEQAIARLNPY